MNDAAAHAVSLPAARQLYEHVAHAVLLYDLPSGQTLYSNSAWARRVGLIEPGKLDQLANFAGRNEVRTVGGPVVLNVSALPLQGHPDVRLVQESTSAPSSVDPTFRTTFPLGVAWIEPTANRVVQLTDAFIKVWGLPPGRISERADRLRTACAGLVLDATAIDKAWPVDTAGTGRFVDVALTDGRSLRISTVDAASEHRWIVVEDVTKPKQRRQARYRRKLQNQETQRLESLSVLAGGIAYDFNKLILAILRNSTVLREESRLDAEGRLAVEHIRSAAEQASKLSAQMLAFSGRGHMITQRTDLKPILHMVADQDSPLPDQPKIALACSGVPPVVMGDPDQLEQLFSAVVSNAREAGATSISIDWAIETWRTDRLSDLYLGERLVSGTYVVVVVEDDGEGIEEVALKRSFEPFFSTRGPGRGLGLAVSAGIARGHGGTIDIRSTAGRGTTVRILLPAAPPRPRPPSSPSSRRREQPLGAILLVDSEALIRRSARYALEQAGFRVTEAENAEQALALFAAQPKGFDLVIMDMAMPDLSGEHVAARMKSMTDRPVPMVLSSGYRATPQPGTEQIADRFLHRPYRRAELVQTARLLLAKRD